MARLISTRFLHAAFALILVGATVWAQPHGAPSQGSNTNPTCNTDGTSANVAFSTSGSNRVITTNQCPNHAIRTINPNAARQSSSFGVTNQQYPLPLSPTLAPSSQIINITCVGGTVGFLRSGAVIYSVFPGTCGGDAVKQEGQTFDECGGHSDQSNTYHYHMTPSCTLSTYTTSTSSHSPILGYMIDGIPLYGPLSDGGVVPSDLDSCGGHASDSGNGGHYHYHFKPILGSWPDPSTPLASASAAGAGWPYTPGCLRGCVPDVYLSTLKNLGVTAQTSYSSCTASGTAQAQAESITSSSGTTTASTSSPAVTTTGPVTPTPSSPVSQPSTAAAPLGTIPQTSTPTTTAASPTSVSSTPVSPTFTSSSHSGVPGGVATAASFALALMMMALVR